MIPIKQLRPRGTQILVKMLKPNEMSPGGIYVPSGAGDKTLLYGEVISVGPGRISESGSSIPVTTRIGEIICFGQYSGFGFKSEAGEDYKFMEEKEILGSNG